MRDKVNLLAQRMGKLEVWDISLEIKEQRR